MNHSRTGVLTREVFTTSRELEYFSEAELVTQTGYEREDWWPWVLVKELVDNSLDACEQSGAPPEISVTLAAGTLAVTDNGPGIPSDVVERVLDFSSRTSDKAAYVSPTRGAQGNALKTVLAIPYVLNNGSPATVQIEACGQRHSITVSTDHVARRPRIEHEREDFVKNGGTAVRLQVNSASENLPDENPEFLQTLVSDYSLFNPHATFALIQDGVEHRFPATTPEWQKWCPSDPTSPHWYGVEQFEDLIASYVAAERDGGRPRTVREFVAEFRGFAGTAKQKQVVALAGLERGTKLSDLVGKQGRFDRRSLGRLLDEMKKASLPVKPEWLGVLGEAHFRSRLQGADQSFRYKSLKGVDASGKPYVVECAFALTEEPLLRGLHVGLNWSVPLSNPLQNEVFSLSNGSVLYGLSALLERSRINLPGDPVCVALHLIYPRFQFLDRGKGSVDLNFADEVAKAVLGVTKEWAAIKKQEERNRRQANRLHERLVTGRSSRVTVKDAAEVAMAEAYAKASGNGMYPANARQIMYAARPAIQELTGQTLSDTYFTQNLLPDYITAHPRETASWDVVYDARGHLWEPHTDYEVGLGTLGVREYLTSMRYGIDDDALQVPELPCRFPTVGPRHRFGAILYVEKEGFLPLLRQAKFAERYDLALMSSKGMGTTAVRTLVEKLCGQVKILVLHDFDKSGLSILGTLSRDTRRYKYARDPEVFDLGIRMADVQKWDLQSEEARHGADPRENLQLNGATPEEVAFLRGERRGSNHYRGRRVELNAFTSEQFVQWLEEKLIEHKVEKVVPDSATLERAYRRAAALRKYREILEKAIGEVETYASNIPIPENLLERVKADIAGSSESWDDAVEVLAGKDVA
jgi:DNA topoisomerase VI subunit B